MNNSSYNVRRATTTNLFDGWDSGAYDSYEHSALSGPFALQPPSDRGGAVLGPTLRQTTGEEIMPSLGYASFLLQPHIPAGILNRDVGRRRGAGSASARPLINSNNQSPRNEGEFAFFELEQNEILKKPRKEIYKPKEIYNNPAKLISRVGQYYRGNLISNRYDDGSSTNDREKCVICLEEFQLREEIIITPCNHMFHEDCIVPWAKRHAVMESDLQGICNYTDSVTRF